MDFREAHAAGALSMWVSTKAKPAPATKPAKVKLTRRRKASAGWTKKVLGVVKDYGAPVTVDEINALLGLDVDTRGGTKTHRAMASLSDMGKVRRAGVRDRHTLWVIS